MIWKFEKKDIIDKRLVNSVKYHYLSLRLVCVKACLHVKSLKPKQKKAQDTNKVVES